MEARLINYRQSPRKVRLVAGLVKGKTVPQALIELDVLPKRAAAPIRKLIASAVANATHNFQVDPATLVVTNCSVDKGIVLKRSQPMSRGRAFAIHKHSSHVTLKLGAAPAKKVKVNTKAK